MLDTSVFIEDLRSGRHERKIEALNRPLRLSAVVLTELWRGARYQKERQFLTRLEKNHSILMPTERNWLDSGQVLATIQADHNFRPEKLRDLHFDVLIALTVRSWGATLITINGDDFEMIRGYRPFELEVW